MSGPEPGKQPASQASEPAERGLFIAFEGIDGSGKSTQAKRLCDRLTAAGKRVVHTREPGGTALGERLRELLLDPGAPAAAPWTEVLLLAADRAQHVAEVIRPALAEGRVVVCERYIDSSLAYQGYGLGLSLAAIRDINAAATGGLLPHLTLLLDIAPDERWTAQHPSDRIEGRGEPFLARVRVGYLALAAAEPDRFAVIRAGGRAAADIAGEIGRRVWGRFWPAQVIPGED